MKCAVAALPQLTDATVRAIKVSEQVLTVYCNNSRWKNVNPKCLKVCLKYPNVATGRVMQVTLPVMPAKLVLGGSLSVLLLVMLQLLS